MYTSLYLRVGEMVREGAVGLQMHASGGVCAQLQTQIGRKPTNGRQTAEFKGQTNISRLERQIKDKGMDAASTSG